MKQKIKQMVEKVKAWFKARTRGQIAILIILAIVFAPTLLSALVAIASLAIPIALIVWVYNFFKNKKNDEDTNK